TVDGFSSVHGQAVRDQWRHVIQPTYWEPVELLTISVHDTLIAPPPPEPDPPKQWWEVQRDKSLAKAAEARRLAAEYRRLAAEARIKDQRYRDGVRAAYFEAARKLFLPN